MTLNTLLRPPTERSNEILNLRVPQLTRHDFQEWNTRRDSVFGYRITLESVRAVFCVQRDAKYLCKHNFGNTWEILDSRAEGGRDSKLTALKYPYGTAYVYYSKHLGIYSERFSIFLKNS